ncbi:beta-1,4-N-acetylgalactosaminyltransferase bre-4-like [Cydia fagiglandana]|uniref:beta-1,4-N-acetylgalactosaminyltransferase bre-4-like n=1 Tax=Cydia fagiglandana TaxID=1458189 RepID=UPI002FEDE7A9
MRCVLTEEVSETAAAKEKNNPSLTVAARPNNESDVTVKFYDFPDLNDDTGGEEINNVSTVSGGNVTSVVKDVYVTSDVNGVSGFTVPRVPSHEPNNERKLCDKPSDLGPISVNTSDISLDVVEQKYPEVKLGGRYSPLDCLARHRVAIIVPFRDRLKNLATFLNHMHPFLMKQRLDYGIFIVEQTGTHEFNRGKLLNVGFLEAGRWECYIFHDIDLLPVDQRNLYNCPHPWHPRLYDAAAMEGNEDNVGSDSCCCKIGSGTAEDDTSELMQLMNVGFLEADGWECYIFHDIDLLPLDQRNLYNCPHPWYPRLYDAAAMEGNEDNAHAADEQLMQLMNVGFLEAGGWECYIFHDIDLLPLDQRHPYNCPHPWYPRLYDAAALEGNEDNAKLKGNFGGVSALTEEQFAKANGYSNSYWGWGGEDNDLYYRLLGSGYTVTQYNSAIARYVALKHKQKSRNPKRYRLLLQTIKAFQLDGLSSLEYRLVSKIQKNLYTHIVANIDHTYDEIQELFQEHNNFRNLKKMFVLRAKQSQSNSTIVPKRKRRPRITRPYSRFTRPHRFTADVMMRDF